MKSASLSRRSAEKGSESDFADYFEQFERGWGSAGQAFVSLPEEIRRAVREDVRRDIGDAGGEIKIEVEFRFASGRK